MADQPLDPEPEEQPLEDREERRLAAGEMRVAFRRLQRLRIWLVYNLWMTAIACILIIPYFLFMSPEARVEIGLPGGGLLFAGLVATDFGLAWWTLRSLDRRPFTLVMVMSALHVVGGVVGLIEDRTWVYNAVWAVILMIIAIDAWHLESLARRHPDLYLSKRLRGEHLTHDKKLGGSIRKKRKSERRRRTWRARRRHLLLGGAMVALVFGSIRGYQWYTAPPSPEAMLERFQTAWNAGDLAAVASEGATESMRARLARNLPATQERYQWGTLLPPLDAATWEEVESRKGVRWALVSFPSAAGALKCRLTYADGRWGVVSLDFAALKY